MRKYPIGWKTVKLEAVAEFFNGKPLEGRVTPDGNSSLITLDSVDIKGQLKNNHKKINADGDFLKAGDIVSVLSDIAHGYLLGLSAVIPADDRYVLNQRMGLLRTSSEIDPNFLRLFINFNQSYFRERGQGTSQRHIYKRDFYDFDFSYPPLSEQKAIAKALSDIDELSEKKKIEMHKIKLVYSGCLDTLLDPKKYPNTLTKLSDLCNVKTGTRNNQDKSESGIYKFFVRSDHIERIDSYSYDTEAILVPGEGRIGEIFHYVNEPHEVHQRVYRISDSNSKIIMKYLYWYMKKHFGAHAMTNTVKATVDSLRLPTFLDFEVAVPNLVEQQRVSEILDDLESLLLASEIELAKYECIKQGMAHDLLTGKVRLV